MLSVVNVLISVFLILFSGNPHEPKIPQGQVSLQEDALPVWSKVWLPVLISLKILLILHRVLPLIYETSKNPVFLE